MKLNYFVIQWMPVISTSSGTALNVLITGINCIGYMSAVSNIVFL